MSITNTLFLIYSYNSRQVKTELEKLKTTVSYMCYQKFHLPVFLFEELLLPGEAIFSSLLFKVKIKPNTVLFAGE